MLPLIYIPEITFHPAVFFAFTALLGLAIVAAGVSLRRM